MNRRFPIMLFGGNASDAGSGGDGGSGGSGGDAGAVGQGAGGAGATDWRSSLTGDHAPLAKEKSLEQIKGKDWTEAGPLLAKGYVEAQKLIGGMVSLPKPDPATGKIDEKVQRDFYTKLGVPVDVAGYKDVRLEAIPGLGNINEKLIDAGKGEFLKFNLTPHQAQGMLNFYGRVTAQQRREYDDKLVEGQAVIEEEWGLNYEQNVTQASNVLKKYFPPAAVKAMADALLDKHADVIRGFYELSKHLVEGRFIEGNEPTVADNEALEKQIKDLNEELTKLNEGNPKIADLMKKKELLYKKRYGTAEVGATR